MYFDLQLSLVSMKIKNLLNFPFLVWCILKTVRVSTVCSVTLLPQVTLHQICKTGMHAASLFL